VLFARLFPATLPSVFPRAVASLLHRSLSLACLLSLLGSRLVGGALVAVLLFGVCARLWKSRSRITFDRRIEYGEYLGGSRGGGGRSLQCSGRIAPGTRSRAGECVCWWCGEAHRLVAVCVRTRYDRYLRRLSKRSRPAGVSLCAKRIPTRTRPRRNRSSRLMYAVVVGVVTISSPCVWRWRH